MNESSEQFDSELNKIEHYQKFPVMRPYIGINYGKDNNRRIMLVAESHYLPCTSTISKIPEKWYQTTQADLSTKEIAYINTREILKGDWKPRGHGIFRELDKSMDEYMDTTSFRAMTNVVFMNGFQRPSPKTGDSIKKFCRPIDYSIAAETIKSVIDIVKPNLIIFVSKFTWDKLRRKLPIPEEVVKYDFVCHPGTGGRYWHNKKYMHGFEKFKRIIKAEIDKI